MEYAAYGRMALGKCVTKDYGNVGCQINVLQETDRRCSGKRICRIGVPDAVFDQGSVCPIEFRTYLAASYKCLKSRSLFSSNAVWM